MAREITERRRAKLERVLRWRQKDLTLVLAIFAYPQLMFLATRQWSADAFGRGAAPLLYGYGAPELGQEKFRVRP